DREIDPAGDNDNRHADGGNADNRHLPGHELEVGRRKELRSDKHAENDRNQDETEKRSGPLDERPRRHATVPAVTAIMRSCSDSDGAGTAWARRPRCITAIRSHSPSSTS